jgi:cytochrome c5
MREAIQGSKVHFSRQARATMLYSFLVTFVALLMLPIAGQAADRTGKQVVDTVCSACHGTGLNGAPRIGDRKAWSARAAQGLSSLTQHALDGVRNMPAHGGQPNLTDLEIARAITYMVNQSGGHWIAPINPALIGKERSGEEVVATQCATCHGAGLGGAPKIGDLQAWAPRVKLGVPYLVSSAIHGHGGMPPRGGEASLTDSELSSAILYMINPASAHPAQASPPAQGEAHATTIEPNHKIVGGVEVYLGYVTAESIRALPKGSPERTMHGGIPEGANYYHVNATLFGAKSGTPIDDAKVVMELDWPGEAPTVINLEPMFSEGAGSYGNYTKVRPNVLCPMSLRITRPGRKPVEVLFEHRFER